MATKSSSLVSLVLSLILLQLFVSQVCLTEAIRIPRRISPSRRPTPPSRPPPPPPHHYYTPPSKSPRGGGP
uniref:Transmembrane protein n=2 Tax=Brassica TaxID=3705 RepID=A0A0D3B923_BRAOL